VTDIHLRTLDYLRSREDWDSWMAVFGGTDAVQHVMWRFMDPNHRDYSQEKNRRFGGEILRFFKRMDGALGRLLDSLDRDTVLFVTSDHGFGPLDKWFHVNTWLLQQGYLVLKPGIWSHLKRAMFRLGITPMNVYSTLKALGLGRLKEEATPGRGRGRLQALLPLLFLSFDDVDWSRSRAYAQGQIGPIHFNLKGREPQGIVEPGAEADALRQEIIDRLRQVRDPESGEAVVGEIFRPEALYAGPHLNRAADIVFTPRFEAKRGQIPGFGEVDFGTNRVLAPMNRGGVTAVHRLNGVFMAYGEPIRPGTWLEGAQITDVAPTALHLAGLPVPEDMDGHVLSAALQQPYADPTSIRYGPSASQIGRGSTQALSAEDEAIIVERLRGLGYAA
jgi:predicted AlkP superfamily phosphohydrolase/phosphomutase